MLDAIKIMSTRLELGVELPGSLRQRRGHKRRKGLLAILGGNSPPPLLSLKQLIIGGPKLGIEQGLAEVGLEAGPAPKHVVTIPSGAVDHLLVQHPWRVVALGRPARHCEGPRHCGRGDAGFDLGAQAEDPVYVGLG
jgi:hypothetical protein